MLGPVDDLAAAPGAPSPGGAATCPRAGRTRTRAGIRSTKRISSTSRNGTRCSRLGGHRHLVAADQQAVGQEQVRVEVERLLEQVAVGDVGEHVARRARARSAAASLARAADQPRAQVVAVISKSRSRRSASAIVAEQAGGAAGALVARQQAGGGAQRRGQRAEAAGRRRAPPRPGGARSRRAARRRPGPTSTTLTDCAAKRESCSSAGAEGMPQGSSRRPHGARQLVQEVGLLHRGVVVVGADSARASRRASARSSSASPWPGKPIVNVGRRRVGARAPSPPRSPPSRRRR